MEQREEFMQITKGWASNKSLHDLSPIIREAENWAAAHQPLMPGEEKALRLMRQAQEARGGLSEGGDAGERKADDFAPDPKAEIECGLRSNGRCVKDGTDECRRCPSRQSEAFIGSKAWKKKHNK